MSETRWAQRIDEALARATSQIQLLAAFTPTNATTERARLADLAERGRPLVPAWAYEPASTGDAQPLLEATLRALDALDGDPLVRVYRARAEELLLEADLVHAAGTRAVSELAAKRFASSSLTAAKAADVLVARAREISEQASERTALHEIEGHVLPRTRARKQALGIFRVATARGVDEQEGLALVVEERAGFLVGARRRDLALRAKAVSAMRDGADFGDVVSALTSTYRAPAREAVAIAERVFRGSDGKHAGLGRESVYLESFVEVAETLKNKPDREIVLASGQVSVAAADILASYVV